MEILHEVRNTAELSTKFIHILGFIKATLWKVPLDFLKMSKIQTDSVENNSYSSDISGKNSRADADFKKI